MKRLNCAGRALTSCPLHGGAADAGNGSLQGAHPRQAGASTTIPRQERTLRPLQTRSIANSSCDSAPNMLWVSDFTYVATWRRLRLMWPSSLMPSHGALLAGASVEPLDEDRAGRPRRARTGASMYAAALFDAAVLVHHSDRGSQYVSIQIHRASGRGRNRTASVGSVGDSVSTMHSPKRSTACTRRKSFTKRGPWRNYR